MAQGGGDQNERDDLSDEASPYRLEDMRRKGQVSQSRELAGLLGLMACGGAIFLLAPGMGAQYIEYLREVFRTDLTAKLNLAEGGNLSETLMRLLYVIAALGLPISIVGFLAGALGSFAQIGSIWSTEPLTPDLDKINPIKGLQRFFSMRHFYDGIRLILKAAVVSAVAYGLVKAEVLSAPGFLLTGPGAVLEGFSSSAKAIFWALCAVLMVFAGFDFWLQRWDYMKQARLTKKEAKEEHKEREGDPLIKARIRSVQREMARRRMMQAVKTADVIVTNPTHIAVALKYDKDGMAAPKVVAKGADFVAQRIKKLGAEMGIPIVENVPLARTLFKAVKIGQFIPRSLYQAVAEVLAYVYRLKNKKF
ncbi:MAG: flagellar biosynthesis protein FlhB [Bdellovibrionales bacterium]|nr:flagellar biosynthesis protein FlhB [Bdellovibrionales bacterium]